MSELDFMARNKRRIQSHEQDKRNNKRSKCSTFQEWSDQLVEPYRSRFFSHCRLRNSPKPMDKDSYIQMYGDAVETQYYLDYVTRKFNEQFWTFMKEWTRDGLFAMQFPRMGEQVAARYNEEQKVLVDTDNNTTYVWDKYLWISSDYKCQLFLTQEVARHLRSILVPGRRVSLCGWDDLVVKKVIGEDFTLEIVCEWVDRSLHRPDTSIDVDTVNPFWTFQHPVGEGWVYPHAPGFVCVRVEQLLIEYHPERLRQIKYELEDSLQCLSVLHDTVLEYL